MSEPLILWVVFDHPQDYPDSYVARKFVLDQPTEEHIVSPRLEMLRQLMIGLRPVLSAAQSRG